MGARILTVGWPDYAKCKQHLLAEGASPYQFQSKLNLSRGCRWASDGSSGPRYFCTRGGRGENNQIRCVEIRTVEQVEDLGTKLEGESLAQIGRFEGREIRCCQSWIDQGVSGPNCRRSRCWRAGRSHMVLAARCPDPGRIMSNLEVTPGDPDRAPF